MIFVYFFHFSGWNWSQWKYYLLKRHWEQEKFHSLYLNHLYYLTETIQNKKSVSWYTSSIWLRCYYFFWLNVLQMCYLALPYLLFFMFSTYFVSVCHVSPTRWSSSEHFTLCSELGSMSCFWFSVSRTMPGTEGWMSAEWRVKQTKQCL